MCFLTWTKVFADGIKSLEMEVIPFRWPNVTTGSSKRKTESEGKNNIIMEERFTQSETGRHWLCLETGDGAIAEGGRHPRSWKGRDTDSPPEPPGENSPAHTWSLAQGDPLATLTSKTARLGAGVVLRGEVLVVVAATGTW